MTIMHADQPEGITDDEHRLPSLAGAASRVLEYISLFGDGTIDIVHDEPWRPERSEPLYARDLEALARAAQVTIDTDQIAEALEHALTAAGVLEHEEDDGPWTCEVLWADVREQIAAALASRMQDATEQGLR